MSLPGEEKSTARAKKPYSPPTLVRLDAETVASKLKSQAEAGDTEAQRMLRYITETEKEREEKGNVSRRPTFGLELRFPEVASEAEVSLSGERLNSDLLKVVRRFLELSEVVIQERGAEVISRNKKERAS